MSAMVLMNSFLVIKPKTKKFRYEEKFNDLGASKSILEPNFDVSERFFKKSSSENLFWNLKSGSENPCSKFEIGLQILKSGSENLKIQILTAFCLHFDNIFAQNSSKTGPITNIFLASRFVPENFLYEIFLQPHQEEILSGRDVEEIKREGVVRQPDQPIQSANPWSKTLAVSHA